MRNLIDSPKPVVAWLGRTLTDPGTGQQPHRFTEQSLDALFAPYGSHIVRSFLIPGGREKVFVLQK